MIDKKKGTFYAHVINDWNLCMLLLYIKKFNPQKVFIFHEHESYLIPRLRREQLSSELVIKKTSGVIRKVLEILKLICFKNPNNNLTFIKFSNYSYFGQWFQKALKPNESIFLDEGTTFINLKNDKLRYETGLRYLLKKLLWPRPFKPRFDCFVGVHRAYMTYSQLLCKSFQNKSTRLLDVFEILNYETLNYISNEWLEIKDEIDKWKKQFQSENYALVIGSPYIRTGNLSRNEYLELLNELKNLTNLEIVYKAHPSEIVIDYSIDFNIKFCNDFKLPLELLFSSQFPSTIISFGSTSAFLAHDQSDSKISYLLPEKIFDKEICDLLSLPPLKLNIRRI